MDELEFLLSLVIIIILIYMLFSKGYFEKLISGPKSYVRLYEDFNQELLAFECRIYTRIIVPCNLKSYDIYFAKSMYLNSFIEIWSVDAANNSIASTEIGFYNTYQESDIDLRANLACYERIVQVKRGEHFFGTTISPIKKVYVLAEIY